MTYLYKENIERKYSDKKHYTTFPVIRFGGKAIHGETTCEKKQVVEKVWGTETHIHNSSHCVKVMTLKPGYHCSNHYHSEKTETFILVSGSLIIESTNANGKTTKTSLTEPLESFTLYKNVPHTFYCPDEQKEDTIFIEASTTDYENDSYRITQSGKR